MVQPDAREPGFRSGHDDGVKAMRIMVCASLLACATLTAAVAPGLQGDVVFDRHSPLTTTTRLLDRAMSPLTAARLFAAYAAKHAAPTEYTIDLAAEHFAVYVPPATPPSRGYGLLVFVPPWPDARVAQDARREWHHLRHRRAFWQ